MEKYLKEIGSYLIQIGIYLTTATEDEMNKSQIKDTMILFLIEAYLFLKDYGKETSPFFKLKDIQVEKEQEEKFLTRKEVITEFSPLFTEYGLTQAIHSKGLPYLKRGNRYFFKRSEIENWIKNTDSNHDKTVKYV